MYIYCYKLKMNRSLWLQTNYRSVRQKVPDNVELVVVSKNFPHSDIQSIHEIGHRVFGENYAQELLEKAAQLPKDIQWHFIGGLQSNKIPMLLKCLSVSTIQTVDSVEKAEIIEKHCVKVSRQIDIYLQVNASREPGKHGLHPSVVEPAALHILNNMKRCRLVGLMMIGSTRESLKTNGEENEEFALMKNLRADLERASGKRLLLSMGMSQDYEQAIKQDSNLVRVGTCIFGSRPPASAVVETQTAAEEEQKISLA